MQVTILNECGYDEALLGLSLSYNQDPELMPNVARKLCHKDGGHNKFLEAIVVWLDITAPRYWWSQFDTYRVGVTKQSESTMHTILRRPLSQEGFAHPIPWPLLEHLNLLIAEGQLEEVKWNLPESFLQRRIVCANYKSIRNIIIQRENHRLAEWKEFILALRELEHKELLPNA